MKPLACNEIGVEGCDFVTSDAGGDKNDPVEQMVKHLRKRHGFHLTLDDVAGQASQDLSLSERTVAARLHEKMEAMEV